MKNLVSIKAHRFGGRLRAAGSEYRATNSDARIMVALRNAVYKESSVTPITAGSSDLGSADADSVDASSPDGFEIATVADGSKSPDLAAQPEQPKIAEESTEAATQEDPQPAEKSESSRRPYKRRDVRAED